MARVMMGESHFINLKVPFSIFQVPPFPSTFDLCQIPRKQNLNTFLRHQITEKDHCRVVPKASDLDTSNKFVEAKNVFSA